MSKELIEAQQRELRVKDLTIGQMANDMAAAQAQLKVMRKALEKSCAMIEDEWGLDRWNLGREALAQPTDTTALREMLAQEREKAAKICDELGKAFQGRFAEDDSQYLASNECAAAIRAMGSES